MQKSFKNIVLVLAIGAMALASSVASAATTVAREGIGFAKVAVQAVGEGVNDAITGFMQGAGLMLGLVTLADTYTGKFPVRMTPPDSDLFDAVIPFTFPVANPAVNDILALCKVPAGVKIVDWYIQTDDADSNGTPTLAFSLGSLNSLTAPTALTTTYLSASAIASTGGLARSASNNAWLESTAADRAIGLLFTAVGATYVTGKTGVLVLRLSDAA